MELKDVYTGENRFTGLSKSARDAILRNNRHDPELEKRARQRRSKLLIFFVLLSTRQWHDLPVSLVRVPLADVRREWVEERGPTHFQMAGQHFHLYKDLYGGSMFHPQGLMEAKYSQQGMEVHRGNIIYPNQVRSTRPSLACDGGSTMYGFWLQAIAAPKVVFPQLASTQNGLWTLVLCNPDGNPKDGTKEILHWLV